MIDSTFALENMGKPCAWVPRHEGEPTIPAKITEIRSEAHDEDIMAYVEATIGESTRRFRSWHGAPLACGAFLLHIGSTTPTAEEVEALRAAYRASLLGNGTVPHDGDIVEDAKPADLRPVPPAARTLDHELLRRILDGACLARGVSLREVAHDCGLSPSTLTRLKDGGVHADALLSLCAWLGIEASAFAKR